MSPGGSAPDTKSRHPLGPGALAERLAELPVVVESASVALGDAPVPGYYDDAPRPTAFVSLEGLGRGVGECVAWTAAEQQRFARAVSSLAPSGLTTVGAVHERLRGADPYHAAAIEAAAIDLALRQAHTNLFTLAERPPHPVAYCRSLGGAAIAMAGGPVEAAAAVVAREPWARVKIDVESGTWDASVWRRLAATKRVVVLDFKRRGDEHEIALAHRWLPDAWLEDPPDGALDPAAPWRRKVALDAYVESAADLVPPPIIPGAVNVKAPRVRGPLEALRVLEVCLGAGWAAYMGGMFEVGAGRAQARVLASLFTHDAWNDVAPLLSERARANRLAMSAEFEGYAPLAEEASPPAENAS